MTITPFDRARIWLIRLIAGRDCIIQNAEFDAMPELRTKADQKIFVGNVTNLYIGLDAARWKLWKGAGGDAYPSRYQTCAIDQLRHDLPRNVP